MGLCKTIQWCWNKDIFSNKKNKKNKKNIQKFYSKLGDKTQKKLLKGISTHDQLLIFHCLEKEQKATFLKYLSNKDKIKMLEQSDDTQKVAIFRHYSDREKIKVFQQICERHKTILLNLVDDDCKILLLVSIAFKAKNSLERDHRSFERNAIFQDERMSDEFFFNF